jgi:hypothetical protein
MRQSMTSVTVKENVQILLAFVEWAVKNCSLDMYHIKNP